MVQQVAFKSGFSLENESQEEADRVAQIVGEADDENYWVLASKDGNRKSHYTGAAQRNGLTSEFCIDYLIGLQNR